MIFGSPPSLQECLMKRLVYTVLLLHKIENGQPALIENNPRKNSLLERKIITSENLASGDTILDV